MIVSFSEVAFNHYLYWQSNNKKIVNKINNLIKSIDRQGPLKGEGKPEKLKNNECYSRRITKEDRLVYNVHKNTIIVFSCKGHYID